MSTTNQPSKPSDTKSADQPKNSSPSQSNQQQGDSKDKSQSQDKQQQSSQPKQADSKPQQAQSVQPNSKPQQQASMLSADAIKEKWSKLTGFAKTQWSKLTEDELTKSGGDEQKLTGLVKNRYTIPQEEANKQVKSFFLKHAS